VASVSELRARVDAGKSATLWSEVEGEDGVVLKRCSDMVQGMCVAGEEVVGAWRVWSAKNAGELDQPRERVVVLSTRHVYRLRYEPAVAGKNRSRATLSQKNDIDCFFEVGEITDAGDDEGGGGEGGGGPALGGRGGLLAAQRSTKSASHNLLDGAEKQVGNGSLDGSLDGSLNGSLNGPRRRQIGGVRTSPRSTTSSTTGSTRMCPSPPTHPHLPPAGGGAGRRAPQEGEGRREERRRAPALPHGQPHGVLLLARRPRQRRRAAGRVR
jgi:hypothetical protein